MQYTQYETVGQAYKVSGSTVADVAKGVSIVAAVAAMVLGINLMDAYYTDGFAILSLAAATGIAFVAAIAAAARWIAVRRYVSNTNLERQNGDQIMTFCSVIATTAAGVAAFGMLLQLMDVNLAPILAGETTFLSGKAVSLGRMTLDAVR